MSSEKHGKAETHFLSFFVRFVHILLHPELLASAGGCAAVWVQHEGEKITAGPLIITVKSAPVRVVSGHFHPGDTIPPVFHHEPSRMWR